MIEVGPVSGHLVVWVLFAMGLLVTIVEFRLAHARRTAFGLALATVAAASILAAAFWPGDAKLQLAGGGLVLDGFALFVQTFVMAGVVFSLLLGRSEKTNINACNGLLLLSASGVSLLAMAIDLVGILTGFIAAFIPLLGLAAISSVREGREAALKGLIMVLLSAALFGLGTALLSTQTSTTSLVGIQHALANVDRIGAQPLLVVAIALVLAGLGLFLAVVPCHMLFADLVQGLPTAGANLVTGGLLASGLAACARIVLVAFLPAVQSDSGYLSWVEVIHTAGLVALLVGHGMALVQPKLKRLFACLATGQVGMVLVAISAAGSLEPGNHEGLCQATAGVLVFLAVHAINWVGLFLVVSLVGERDSDVAVARLHGLAKKNPWLAAGIGLALLCMAGMPLTAGFFSRLYLLSTMVQVGWVATAILVALSLGLVLVLCIGLVTAMVMKPAKEETCIRKSKSLGVAAFLSSMAILLLGTLPGGLLELAFRSASSLFIP